MRRVYLAASFAAREEVIRLREVIEGVTGCKVTSSWLDELPLEAGDAAREEWEKRARANEDRLDIERSDAVVVLTTHQSTTGGLHWETGYAQGSGIPVIILGPRVSVFHYQNDLTLAEDIDDLLGLLNDWSF